MSATVAGCGGRRTSPTHTCTQAHTCTHARGASDLRHWWTLWFALILMGAALALTLLPVKHLLAWRGVLAHFFSMLAVLMMIALNSALPTYVWCASACVCVGGVRARRQVVRCVLGWGVLERRRAAGNWG